jgi:hypothetical protein
MNWERQLRADKYPGSHEVSNRRRIRGQGTWLSREQARDPLAHPELDTMEGKRDRAILAVLLAAPWHPRILKAFSTRLGKTDSHSAACRQPDGTQTRHCLMQPGNSYAKVASYLTSIPPSFRLGPFAPALRAIGLSIKNTSLGPRSATVDSHPRGTHHGNIR